MSVYGPASVGGPDGLTYAVLLADLPPEDLYAPLVEARFTGWVGPGEGRWSVAVPRDPLGHVASHRRRLHELGIDLATATGAAVVTAVVLRDELLTLTASQGAQTALTYVSDPSLARPGDDQASDWPEGAEDAPALAAFTGHPEVAPDVALLLGETLGESENESERLQALARLLGWPQWMVSVTSLPRRVPGGPEPGAFARLVAGRTGMAGWAAGSATRVTRRRT